MKNNCELTIEALAPLIRNRKISPVELTRFLLERISRLQPAINAYITVTADIALMQAKRAEKEIAKAEDRLLERMMAAEEYEHKVKTAEAAVKEVEAVADRDRRAIQSEYKVGQKELTAAEGTRAAIVAAVPADLIDHYERIAKRHGGIALAEVHEEICGQCGVHIRPHVIQQLQRASNEEIFHCETCTRIMYYPDAPPAPPTPETSAEETPSAPAQENQT